MPLPTRNFRLKPPGAAVRPIYLDRQLVTLGTGTTATGETRLRKTLTTPYQATLGVGASKQKPPPARAA